MTAPDLTALSGAATSKKPLGMECVEGGVWQLRLIFGEGDDACHAMRKWSDAYRSGDLVLIDREEWSQSLQDHFEQHHGLSLTASAWDEAIAAVLGEKP